MGTAVERKKPLHRGRGWDRTRPALLPEAPASPAAWGSDKEDTHSWWSESRLVHRPAVAVELWISPLPWALL